MDGVGQRVLAVEGGGGVIGVGVVVHGILGDEDFVIAHQAVAALAVHQHAVLIQLGDVQVVGIEEGRPEGGIHALVLDVAGQGLVALQQPLDGGILVAGIADQVQRHILFQGGGDALALVGKAVKGLAGHVQLRHGRG